MIYNFQGGSDGAIPTGPLLLVADGSLYGTTVTGGGAGGCQNGGCGTVYKIDANGNESVLYSFTGGNDGISPYSGVIADEQGNLYGTTPVGGRTLAAVTVDLRSRIRTDSQSDWLEPSLLLQLSGRRRWCKSLWWAA